MYPQLPLLKGPLFVHEIQLRLLYVNSVTDRYCPDMETPELFPITAYTGRLCLKGVLFLGFRYRKGYGIHLLKYMKGQGNLSLPSVKSAIGDSLVHEHQPPVWPECIVFLEALVCQAGFHSYRQHQHRNGRNFDQCKLDLPGIVQ